MILAFALSSCVMYRPDHSRKMTFLDRTVEKTQEDVTVSVVALSDKEASKLFGAKLAKKGIQPVWFKIENRSKQAYIFSQRSVDARYYSPAEAAYIAHYSAMKRVLTLGVFGLLFFPILLAIPVELAMVEVANHKMNSFFLKEGMENNVIQPKEVASGFVFTPIKQGTREVHLKLYSERGILEFVFFVEVPGLKFDYEKKDFDALYPASEIVNYTDSLQLKAALERLPETTSGKNGKREGDPLNLVMIATLDELLTYFASAHWDQTEALDIRSAQRMAKSFVFGRSNLNSPFSSLFLWGRNQDISFQKARQTISERLHLRLWFAPMRFQSKPVWVGSVSRDIGVRFTLKTWNLMTHKIDSNIDDARDYVLVDFAENGLVERYGFLADMTPVEKTKPKRNLTDDFYYTDGARVVIKLGERDSGPSNFEWQSPFEIEKKAA